MSEPATPEGAARRPIPDLGFFAGAATSTGGGTFGGGTFGGGAATQVGAPPAASPNLFGSPPATPFGAPSRAGAGLPPSPKLSPFADPTVKIVAVAVGLLLVVSLVVGGRFGWRHFAATPVLPDTLQGMPRLDNPAMEGAILDAQESVAKDLTDGSEAKVALYSDGTGQGYLLFALRGGSRPGEDGNVEEFEGAVRSAHGDIECYTMPTEAGAPMSATMCMRAFYRRAVLVLALGVTPPAAVTVAAAAQEAWDAQ